MSDLGYLMARFDQRSPRPDYAGSGAVAVRDKRVALGSDRGDGHPHTRPPDGNFFALGDQLWTGGWLRRMPGQALAVLLVLTSRMDSRDPTAELWVATNHLTQWYGFGPRAWQTGADYLVRARLFKRRKVQAHAETTKKRTLYSPDGARHPWMVPQPTSTDAPKRRRYVSPPPGAVVYSPRRTYELVEPLDDVLDELVGKYEQAETAPARHRVLDEIIDFAARHASEHAHARVALERYAEEQVELSEAYRAHFGRAPRLPRHKGYQHLIEMRQSDGRHAEALELARRAARQGWARGKYGWQPVVDRLGR